jgi:hypothetical protein
MNSELLIPYFRDLNLLAELKDSALQESIRIAGEIFLN